MRTPNCNTKRDTEPKGPSTGRRNYPVAPIPRSRSSPAQLRVGHPNYIGYAIPPLSKNMDEASTYAGQFQYSRSIDRRVSGRGLFNLRSTSTLRGAGVESCFRLHKNWRLWDVVSGSTPGET